MRLARRWALRVEPGLAVGGVDAGEVALGLSEVGVGGHEVGPAVARVRLVKEVAPVRTLANCNQAAARLTRKPRSESSHGPSQQVDLANRLRMIMVVLGSGMNSTGWTPSFQLKIIQHHCDGQHHH